MTDKKPNQGRKKGNKPGLSSATEKDRKAEPPKKSEAQPQVKPTAGAASPKPDAQRAVKTAAPGTSSSAASTTAGRQAASDKKSAGWIAPVALLFGLLGTGFSAYLYSKLNSLAESTNTTIQRSTEAEKTDVAGVHTALD